MPSEKAKRIFFAFFSSVPWRIAIASTIWFIFISLIHYKINFNFDKREKIKMGYMPVVTNLACPLLDEATKHGNGPRFESIKFFSFAEMAEALRNDQIQAAFIIAPLSIVLKQQGEDIKIVYIGHRHESTLVVRKDLNVVKMQDLEGKTLAVPMRYSGHNISILQLVETYGLRNKLKIVEMNPPDMASALVSGTLDAYYVGEPFASQSILSGHAKLFHRVEDFWPGFICNLLIVKQEFIEKNPAYVKMLVHGAARSGIWAKNNQKEAADIASRYWNQSSDLVEFALLKNPDRIIYNQFVPFKDEIQYLADEMVRFNLLESNNIADLVEDGFALTVDLNGIKDLNSIVNEYTLSESTKKQMSFYNR